MWKWITNNYVTNYYKSYINYKNEIHSYGYIFIPLFVVSICKVKYEQGIAVMII